VDPIFKVGAIALFGRYIYVEMIRFVMIKSFSYADYLPVHSSVLLIVVSTRVEDRDLFMEVSTWLMDTARDIFTLQGYQCDLRICLSSP
jgi:hypothetical protein